MPATENPALLSIAEAILDGKSVDWSQVKPQAVEAEDPPVLREMRVLERITNFHRPADPSNASTTGSGLGDTGGGNRSGEWGHFKIVEKVGGGTFGCVYRAQDRKLQREVALKLVNPSDPGRALREARLLARVRHPNVVTVFGADRIDGCIGLWMEFVKGRTLASLLATHGSFSAREAAGIGLDLCRALAAVHRVGLLHGDVKAQNVMREEGGRTVLMDFGTGKDLTTGGGMIGDFAGTPLYVPPEVFDGEPRTVAADFYSLGVLLFHLVTGDYPVKGRTREDVERAHRRGQRSQLHDVRPDLPEAFIQTVERALSTNPRDRYQTAGAFGNDLAAFLGAKADVPLERRPGWVLIAASFAAAVLLGGYVYVNLPRLFHFKVTDTVVATPAVRTTTPATSTPSAVEPTYQIDTALYTVHGQREERLYPGARVRPGDQLFVQARVSNPTYLYIVNEDDQGESYLLFPLPGQNVTNPLPAGRVNRLPGDQGAGELYWQVTSAGGREHFLIFASPERLTTFEKMFAALRRPEAGKAMLSTPLSREAVGVLRGVGGLVPARPTSPPSGQSRMEPSLLLQFPTPLGQREETARGLWVRQLTLENPLK
jgi:hypothetical protein